MSDVMALLVQHSRRVTWLIVIVALVVRLGYAASVGLDRPIAIGSDEAEYDAYGWSVAQGHGYRGMSPDVADQDHLTAYRSPGPSLVYAALYVVAGHRPIVARLLNCIAGALACLLIVAIGRNTVGEVSGLGAAAIWAFWPQSIYLSGTLASESLALLALLWLVLAALKFAQQPSLRGAIIAGAILGANLLLHPSRLFLFPVLALWAIVQFRTSWRALGLAILVPVIAILFLVPWVIRNEKVFGRFIPFSTMGGSVLLQGNNRITATDPEYLGYNVWDTDIPEYRDALRAPNDEFARDSVAKSLATAWLKANRGQWIPMAIAKIRRGWTPVLQSHTPRMQRLAMLLSWGPVLVAFVIGFIPWLLLFLRKRHPGWLLHMVILHMVALNVIFFGLARYRYVVEPFCVLLAVGTVVWALTRRRGNPLEGPAPAV